MNEIMQLKQWIADSDNIVFFGGAGVSTESGIPDFRSTDGLYNQQYDYPPETILSHSFYKSNPEAFWRFYRDKMLCLDARPNPAHTRLAQLEQAGKLGRSSPRISTDSTRRQGAEMSWSSTAASTATTASAAGSSTRRRTSSTPPVCPGAPAAAPSSRMWYSTRRGWTRTRWSVRWRPSGMRRCSSSAARLWWSIRRRAWCAIIGGTSWWSSTRRSCPEREPISPSAGPLERSSARCEKKPRFWKI